MVEIKVGDVVRARNWTHCTEIATFNFGVGKGSKDVALMLYIGTEPRDGSKPLCVERRLNDLGWFFKPDADPRGHTVTCPHCGDMTQQDVLLAEFTWR